MRETQQPETPSPSPREQFQRDLEECLDWHYIDERRVIALFSSLPTQFGAPENDEVKHGLIMGAKELCYEYRASHYLGAKVSLFLKPNSTPYPTILKVYIDQNQEGGDLPKATISPIVLSPDAAKAWHSWNRETHDKMRP